MDNKLSELSKPVAWTDERGNLCTNRNKERGLESRYHQDYEKYTTPFYSQEYVSALDKVAQFWIGESAGWKQRAEDAEKRIAELEAIKADASQVFKEIGNELGCNPDNESIMMAIDKLKERLATPVRLPDTRKSVSGDRYQWSDGAFNYKQDAIAMLRAAGFTVEGEDA